MKAKQASRLLPLILVLAASTAHAKYEYSYGLSVVQGDPALATTATAANINSSASTGETAAHAATVQFLAVVTFTPDSDHPTAPTSVSVPYRLINYSEADVTLGGMTPPSGAGNAYGSVANALSNTGTLSRGTNEANSYFVAGPLFQDKTRLVTVTQGQ